MIHRWVALPLYQDDYKTFAARVLHYTLLLLLGVALLFALFATSPLQLIFIPIVVALVVGCYFLLHTGRFRLASTIFVSVLWSVITLASFSINGILNASISTYAVVIIFAAVLFPKRAVVIATVLSIAASVVLTLGELQGVLPLRTTPLYLADRLFQQVALFGTVGILLHASSRTIRTSFEKIRSAESTLLQRNRQLELEIVERHRIEASLRSSEAKYRLLFENIGVMAVVYNQAGEVMMANRAAAQTLESTQEALLGRRLHDIFAHEAAETGLQIQAEVMQSGKDVLIESNAVLPSGREITYLRHIIPLPDATHEASSQVLVITTDLTEKQLAQQRARELVLEQEKNAFLRDFFSTLSHDLKTPLAVMNTSLYLLQRSASPLQQAEKTAIISEQITLMDNYIEDMLTISRLEHLPSFSLQPMNLNESVAQVVNLLRPHIEKRQLNFEFTPQPSLATILGDHEQIQRLLLNLIENAINYTPNAGRVSVNTHTSLEKITFEVSDSGIGIEPEALTDIFGRFFRTTRAVAFNRKGTGLGLAIVQKIVDIHTATIHVASRVGEGTTFSVQFPPVTVPEPAV